MVALADTQLKEAYVGESAQEVIQKARPLINKWPDYSHMNDEEILNILLAEDAEFELLKIEKPWQGDDLNISQATDLYNNYSSHPSANSI